MAPATLPRAVASASHAFSPTDSYFSGFTLQRRGLPFEDFTELAEVARGALKQFGRDHCPNLAEMVLEYILQT